MTYDHAVDRCMVQACLPTRLYKGSVGLFKGPAQREEEQSHDLERKRTNFVIVLVSLSTVRRWRLYWHSKSY